MKFTATALLLLLSAFTFGSPAPAPEPEADAEMTPRDIDVTERDNVIVARDVTCSHRASTRQSCRSSPWSDSTHVGWLNPRPATFGVRCYDIGATQGGTQNPNRFYYYVPWYACWIWSGIVTCQSTVPACSH